MGLETSPGDAPIEPKSLGDVEKVHQRLLSSTFLMLTQFMVFSSSSSSTRLDKAKRVEGSIMLCKKFRDHPKAGNLLTRSYGAKTTMFGSSAL